MKNTYEILAKNIQSIASQDELDEMERHFNIQELEEFYINNKNIEAVAGNTDLFNIYKSMLNEKINKLK